MRPTSLTSALLLAVLACATPGLTHHAAAQDEGAGDEGARDDGAGTEKRRVSPEAEAALVTWGKAMHLPRRTTADTIVAHASASNQSMFGGGELAVTTTWKRDGGLSLTVSLPQEMTDSLPPEAVEMAKSMFETWAREALAPAFESPEQYAGDYHVGLRKPSGKAAAAGETPERVVELLPYDDDAAAELQLLYFDERGLCERRVLIPRVDVNDPAQSMMVGAEIESTFDYEKIGERYVVKRMSMLLPIGELLVEYDYYEITDGPPLLKTVSMVTPFAADPIEVTLHDYTMDGNEVAATKREEPAGEGASESGDEESGKTDEPDKKSGGDGGGGGGGDRK